MGLFTRQCTAVVVTSGLPGASEMASLTMLFRLHCSRACARRTSNSITADLNSCGSPRAFKPCATQFLARSFRGDDRWDFGLWFLFWFGFLNTQEEGRSSEVRLAPNSSQLILGYLTCFLNQVYLQQTTTKDLLDAAPGPWTWTSLNHIDGLAPAESAMQNFRDLLKVVSLSFQFLFYCIFFPYPIR